MSNIAFDAFSNGTNSGANSLTIAHTCTGSNGLLRVGVSIEKVIAGVPTDDITGVTYNGVAMTQLGKIGSANSGGDFTYLYELVGPATGNHNIVISNSGTTDAIIGMGVSYTGVNQLTSPTVYTEKLDVAATTFDLGPITTVTDQSWVAGILANNGGGAVTITSSHTQRAIQGQRIMLDTNADITPPGNNTASVTAASQIYTGVLAAIVPSVGGFLSTNKGYW